MGSEDGKSSAFIQNSVVIESIDYSEYASFCFTGTGEADLVLATGKPDATMAKQQWYNNGFWNPCSGENEVCQIKVTRRRNEIFSIVSKCANNKSCVDNMKTNYAPHWDPSGSQVYAASWARQACRPTFGESSLANFYGAASARARGGNPSECFYCVEPCRSRAAVIDGEAWDALTGVTDGPTEAAAMADEYCIGRGSVHDGENSIAFQDFDIFDEASWAAIDPAQDTWDPAVRIDGALLTSDLTLTRTDIHGEPETYTTTVSNIQMEQIRQRVDRGQGQNEVADLVDGFASN